MPIDSSANLTKFSQLAGAYATTIIDKEIEVQMLLKGKEDKILSLEQQLQQAKSNQQAEIQLAKLQQEFEQMRIKHQAILPENEAQIQGITDLHKDDN